MNKGRPFILQLVIVGGFLMFLYIFFALATSIYRDYKLEVNIEKFGDEIQRLADMAYQKPEDVKYFQSQEYKDKYAKENLNLLNPGERLIIIPQENQIVKLETATSRFKPRDVFELPNRNQWWEYFFGHTLSVQAPKKEKNETLSPEDRLDTDQPLPKDDGNTDKESLLELEG